MGQRSLGPIEGENTDWTDYVTQTALPRTHAGNQRRHREGERLRFVRIPEQQGHAERPVVRPLHGQGEREHQPDEVVLAAGQHQRHLERKDYGMSTLKADVARCPMPSTAPPRQIYNFAVPYDENGKWMIHPGGRDHRLLHHGRVEPLHAEITDLPCTGQLLGTIDFGEIFKPLEGLRYKISFGPDFRHWREGVYIDGYSSHKIDQQGNEGVNYSRLQNRRDFSWTLDNMIMFDRTFAEKHKVGVTLLADRVEVEHRKLFHECQQD